MRTRPSMEAALTDMEIVITLTLLALVHRPIAEARPKYFHILCLHPQHSMACHMMMAICCLLNFRREHHSIIMWSTLTLSAKQYSKQWWALQSIWWRCMQFSGKLINTYITHRHICFSRQKKHFNRAGIIGIESKEHDLDQDGLDLTVLVRLNFCTKLKQYNPNFASQNRYPKSHCNDDALVTISPFNLIAEQNTGMLCTMLNC